MPQKQKKPGHDKAAGAARPQLPNGNGGNPCLPSDIASATISGPATIPINGTVQLTGTAEEFILSPNCQLRTKPTPFTWSLFFTPPAGSEVAVGGLSGSTTLTPTFVASQFGVYRAVISAGTPRLGFSNESLSITVFRPMELLESEGQLTFLRVNEVGDSFGPAGDSIQVEAIVQLNTQPGMSFGFELRNDKQRPAHQGMLDLLRDAFVNDLTVLIDYFLPEGNHNGTIIRVALTK